MGQIHQLESELSYVLSYTSYTGLNKVCGHSNWEYQKRYVDYCFHCLEHMRSANLQNSAHLQNSQCPFADNVSRLDLHIQYKVLSMRDIVEVDT